MTSLNSKQKEWLNKLSNEINKQITNQNFIVEDLVQPMMTSRTQLYNRIKTLTGLTPNQYIQKLRLDKAQELILLNIYDSIHQIIHQVGFKRLDEFAKLYHEHFGTSPKAVFEKLWGERLRRMILKNLVRSTYTVEDLIFDMNMDRKRLYERTKRITGLSPGRYIRKLRLEKAKEVIENGEFNTIKEVAASVGFQRTDYFSNLYEAHYSYRPLDYKK